MYQILAFISCTSHWLTLWPPHRYEIMNFQHVQPGVYDYINIGSWHEGLLSLDEEMIRMNRSDMVRSVCSEPCSKGEIKVADDLPACRCGVKDDPTPCGPISDELIKTSGASLFLQTKHALAQELGFS